MVRRGKDDISYEGEQSGTVNLAGVKVAATATCKHVGSGDILGKVDRAVVFWEWNVDKAVLPRPRPS